MNIFELDEYKRLLNKTITLCPLTRLCGKTILLTGSTGLIGSFFVDMIFYFNQKNTEKIHLIAINHSRSNLDRRFPYIINDKNIELISSGVEGINNAITKIDYIIHAASLADPVNFSKHPVETITSCVLGTVNLLNIAKYNNAKFLLISSREVYGFISDATQYTEDDFGLINFNKIRAAYPEGKRISELLCKSYLDEYNVYTQIARLGYVYGPTKTDTDSRVIAQFLRDATDKKDIVLKSSGTQRRSYTYVGDVFCAIVYILVYGDATTYNVADSKSEISIAELAVMIAQKANTTVAFAEQSADEIKGSSDNHDALLDATRLHTLGWNPSISLESGIEQTISILRLCK